jgi:NADH dehydrogenase FAD-containing subunit
LLPAPLDLQAHRNVRVLLGTVTEFEPRRTLGRVEPGARDEGRSRSLRTLIVAGGSHYAYFRHDDAGDGAGIKSLESAARGAGQIRSALRGPSWRPKERRRAWHSFVVVGGDRTE